MVPTDVSGTLDTTNANGDAGAQFVDTQFKASNKDTENVGGESVATAYTGNLLQPKESGTKDTEGVQGGHHSTPATETFGLVSGTLSTLEPGSPRRDKDPAYRAPLEVIAPIGAAGAKDTTRTDSPVADLTHAATFGGSGWDDHTSQANQYQSGTKDTVNPTVTLRTTSTLKPVAPGGAPTVVALPRGVKVTVAAVADPSGAAVRGYRVESNTGGVDFIPRDASGGPAARTIIFGTLVPSVIYKFRYQAVNDNGSGPWSAYSANVVPLNPDEAGPGHAMGLSEDNKVNPIYSPAGVIKPGTGGTTGPVATCVAAATLVTGELKIDWTAPAWGVAPTNYEVKLSTGETSTVGAVLTKTFTGLTSVPRTATITPINAKGRGIAKTTNAATSLP